MRRGLLCCAGCNAEPFPLRARPDIVASPNSFWPTRAPQGPDNGDGDVRAEQAFACRGGAVDAGRRAGATGRLEHRPHHQSVCGRRYVGRDGAPAAAEPAATARFDHHRREPARRLGLDRCCGGGEIAARRHDLAAHLRHVRRQHIAAQQSALRRAEGFRAGDDDRARTDGAVRASLAALPHVAGACRRGEGGPISCSGQAVGQDVPKTGRLQGWRRTC